MRIILLSFGKLKTPGLREAADYYQRVLRPWSRLEEIELKSEIVPPDKSSAAKLQVQKKEMVLLDRQLQKLSSRRMIYLLSEQGQSLDTQDWTKLIEKAHDDSIADMVFCIGSSLGFADDIKRHQASINLISLGKQTMSHELARVVLLEQIFRAMSVLKGHPYHNGN